ncbi:RsfA family transcriptional regulator [Oceanobacillus sp. FSL H7-0719]|uniref:RsfA family transcriptional regulator n=1 Tax=Oceanobacillus sp. FSL H7-0719 TaxID=2954507 RepID=UPI003250F73B
MKETRQDAWTREEDDLLAETVLQYIKNGKTQLEAFKVVANKLARTPAACGFRWNATIRKQYEGAIQSAKEERKKASSQALQELHTNHTGDKRMIESVIQILEKIKHKDLEEEVQNYQVQAEMLHHLQEENHKLVKQVERYKNAWQEMEKLWSWVQSDKEAE